MKSILSVPERANILSRLAQLDAGKAAQWGKMNAGEMVAHCQYPLEVALGTKHLKRGLIGLLFGKMIKRQLLSGKDLPQNAPTVPSWRTAGSNPDFEQNRTHLTTLIERFGNENRSVLDSRRHPVFGKMTADEWGVLNFKHLDHHLRQFGV